MKNEERLDSKFLGSFATEVRKDILKMIYASQASHIGSALSSVDILAVLYNNILKNNPKDPLDSDRDRFLLSKGHACTALYATLAEKGYFEKSLLDNYSKNGSILMSHINSEVDGVEFSTGSLGHALPVATGIALAGKRKGKKYRTFVLLSDGELNEGSNWEAFLMAAHLNLNKLIAIIDVNKIQALGFTKDVINVEPIEGKLKAFGWLVKRTDGHKYSEIYRGLKNLIDSKDNKPKVLITDTVKGKGVSYMENKLKWHYSSPNEEEFQLAMKELGEK